MILIIDTHCEEAKLAIETDDNLIVESWKAGRELSSTILVRMNDLYEKAGKKMNMTDSVIVNLGPGSFTSLRIGISIANTIAFALDIPIVGVEKEEKLENVVKFGKKFLKGETVFAGPVSPVYGAEPNITKPKEK